MAVTSASNRAARALSCGVLGCWLLVLSMAVQAQDVLPREAVWSPGTGDAWIDAHLVDMNLYAVRHRDAFIDEVVRYHEAPRALVESALEAEGAIPADVYYACLLAQAGGRPCRAVLDARRMQPGAEWSALAADPLGIALDAAALRRLREDIRASYLRWARPLDGTGKPAR